MLAGEEPPYDLLPPVHTVPEKLREGSDPASFKERLVAIGWWAQEPASFSPQILKCKPPTCFTQSSMIPNIKPFTRAASPLSRCPVRFSQPEMPILLKKRPFYLLTMKTTVSA